MKVPRSTLLWFRFARLTTGSGLSVAGVRVPGDALHGPPFHVLPNQAVSSVFSPSQELP